MTRDKGGNKRNKKRFVLALSFFVCFLFFVSFLARFPLANFVTVDNIVCKTQYGPCDQQDLELASRFIGKNLFLVTSAEVGEMLSGSFKNNKVFVSKYFPDTLSLVIEKRKGFVAVSKPDVGSGFFLVSSDGTALSYEESSALPKLVLSEEVAMPVVGGKVDQDLINAGKTLSLLRLGQNVSTADFSKEGLAVSINWDSSSISVTFPANGDPELLTGALQLILSQAKMDGKIPKVIDLRYKNPVLRY
ncbi:MAG: hypothetical protein HYW33_01870 [Candidatus Blackburnbacteria bacterium]|nr:hypothetical protein [Candidatus Blackburnbacteria bacterium]